MGEYRDELGGVGNGVVGQLQALLLPGRDMWMVARTMPVRVRLRCLPRSQRRSEATASVSAWSRSPRCSSTFVNHIDDVRASEIIDPDYAAAMVTVRTGVPLNSVRILEIEV